MIDLEITQQQTKFRILLVGDSCQDQYYWGMCERLSPEAPVPIIKIIDNYSIPGMAANVYKNLQNLRINCDFITNKEEIIKARYIDKRSGQHLLRVDSDVPLLPWNQEIPSSIGCYDAIVISDYNKGFLTYKSIETLINSTNKPIFIDTKKPDLKIFSGEHVYVKINETEYRNRSSEPQNLIITLGDRGAMLKTAKPETEQYFPISPSDVVDVCGCGDTFLAALTYAFLNTQNIQEAIVFANKASGITVQHQGNYAPTIQEILNA